MPEFNVSEYERSLHQLVSERSRTINMKLLTDMGFPSEVVQLFKGAESGQVQKFIDLSIELLDLIDKVKGQV